MALTRPAIRFNNYSYTPKLDLEYYILEKAHRKRFTIYRNNDEYVHPKAREPLAIRHPGKPIQRIPLAAYPDWRSAIKCPTFTVRLYNQVIAPTKNATLKVKVDGSPDPEVRWYRNGTPVTFSTTVRTKRMPNNVHVLIIREATVKDCGAYECRARNEAGTICTSCYVFVEQPGKLLWRPVPWATY